MGEEPAESNEQAGGSSSSSSSKHINFFEDIEEEIRKHNEEHQKTLRYQRKNNELASGRKVSDDKTLSEFDQIKNNVPWYLKERTPREVQEEHTPSRDTTIEQPARPMLKDVGKPDKQKKL